jgi:hypothetical protein
MRKVLHKLHRSLCKRAARGRAKLRHFAFFDVSVLWYSSGRSLFLPYRCAKPPRRGNSVFGPKHPLVECPAPLVSMEECIKQIG